MSRWRLYVLAVLLLLPVLFLMAMGSVYLWTTEIGSVSAWFVLWWPSFLCLSGAFFLAWWWQRQNRLIPAPDWTPDLHWTERDKEAWQLVEQRAKGVAEIDPNQLLDVQFYFDTARDMAIDLARFYHPGSRDPFGPLRIPEILAVAQLAAEDLTELVDTYVPGGHLLTIDHWRTASKLSDWYSHATTAYWLASALYSPINTAARFIASKLGTSRPLELLGANLKAWFYTAFVHRVGHYLIELNSGRLRVGARRYRELLVQHGFREPATGLAGDGATGGSSDAGTRRRGDAASSETAPFAVSPRPHASASQITITLFGQVKAGKSSLVNALLGERRAATDVLPLTNEITKYELALPASSPDQARSSSPPYQGGARGGRRSLAEPASADPMPARLILLDTVGYGHEGPKADQLQATIDAVEKSDIALLVLHARDPARQPDVEVLHKLHAWFRDRPQLKMPPILGVLTHIDLLSPLMDWSPPYDYLPPRRAKERSFHDAVVAAREQFGERLLDVVPVCTAEGKTLGVQEWLLPQIVARLDEARAVALLRCLNAEIDEGKVRRVFEQVYAAGKELFRLARQR